MKPIKRLCVRLYFLTGAASDINPTDPSIRAIEQDVGQQ